MNKLLTIDEVAAIIGLTPRAVRRIPDIRTWRPLQGTPTSTTRN
jgi:hypothetical protein